MSLLDDAGVAAGLEGWSRVNRVARRRAIQPFK
jgi:hypothetical protein